MSNIKSAWPENANIHRAASRGKVFTRRERENLIENEKLAKRYAAGIQEAREEIKTEKRDRAARFLLIKGMLENPEEKIKLKKTGQAYFQRRINGKFQPATVIV